MRVRSILTLVASAMLAAGALTPDAVVARANPRDLLPQRQAPDRRARLDLRAEGALKPGDLAVDFTLEPRGGGAPVTLSSFRGKKAVALVFGSYT
jgi:hypothetical protein